MIKKILLLSVPPIFTLCLMEISFRLIPLFSSTYNINRYYVKPQHMYPFLRDKDNCYRSSSLLGWEQVPATGWFNSYGVVGEEYSLEKEADTFRILFIGDSVTADNWYVEDLKGLLQNSKTKYKFELWNAAVAGYNINQYANYLVYKGKAFYPDMVIVGLCLNDISTPLSIIYRTKEGFIEYRCPFQAISRKITLNKFLFLHSYTYRFFISSINNFILTLHSRNRREISNDDKIKEIEEQAKFYLSQIKRNCENKIKLLIIVFPYFKPLKEYSALEKNEYKIIIKTLNNLNILYLDLNSYFPDNDRFRFRQNDYDYIHPNRNGHNIIAKATFKCLMDSFVKINE